MHKLEKRIRETGRLALIPFITAGYPDTERFWEAMTELDEGGADIIEVGVPFSDPVADGPVVEDASRQVLARGVTLEKILEGLRQRKFKAGIVLMGYINPFLQYGYEKLAKDAVEAGVEGFIVPDLQYDEDMPLREILDKHDLALISLVGPNTPPERMRLYAQKAKGYVYVVSVMGTTGERKEIAAGISRVLDTARKEFKVPVALGFGLKEPAQLEILPENSRPDAAVFGSALLKHLDAGGSARDFMDRWTKC